MFHPDKHYEEGYHSTNGSLVNKIDTDTLTFFSPDKPISPKAIKGFDVPQLTKNYYNVVSYFIYATRHLMELFCC